jgi:predicted RNA-binding protein associated with RNAse of E/G family
MNTPILYRRRYIPDEKILLKDDEVIEVNDDVVITRWNVLTKRHDFTHGVSCYYIKEGFKISKFLDENDNLVYWYCDIIETSVDKETNTYTFNDLLVDVIIYPDGFVKVVDMDEVALALKEKILDTPLLIKLMERLDKLLNIIYDNRFDDYKRSIENL